MQSAAKQQARLSCGAVLLCSFYCLGIVVALLAYGLWQEKVISRPYHTGTDMSEYLAAFSRTAVSGTDPKKWPTDDDYFPSSVFLVLVSRVVSLLFALVMMIVRREPFGWQASVVQYLLLAVSTVAASTCQFEALKYVTFALLILGKSFKMFPLMCHGFFAQNKSYRTVDWLVGFIFCGGVIAYAAGGQITPAHHSGNAWLGIGLLVAFIGLDNITSNYQDKVFLDSSSSKYNQMLYINIFSILVSALIMLIQEEWNPTVTFVSSHPLVLMDASIMSTWMVLAQWFLYAQAHSFGALAFMATMNFRQIISVVASILVYHHLVTGLQVAALSVCCGALFWQVLGGAWQQGAAREETPLLGEAKPLADSGGSGRPLVPWLGRDRSAQQAQQV